MALDRSDHKRIAQTIAQELQRVLGDSNGQRVIGRHQQRLMGPPHSPDPTEAEPEDLDDMMQEMSTHPGQQPDEIEAQEVMDAGTEHSARHGPPAKFKKAGSAIGTGHLPHPSKGGGMKHGRR